MFKQITNFEEFNIFVGSEQDLEYKEKTLEFRLDEISVEYTLENYLEYSDTHQFVNKILDKLNNTDVYIISKNTKNFVEFWIREMVLYLK